VSCGKRGSPDSGRPSSGLLKQTHKYKFSKCNLQLATPLDPSPLSPPPPRGFLARESRRVTREWPDNSIHVNARGRKSSLRCNPPPFSAAAAIPPAEEPCRGLYLLGEDKRGVSPRRELSGNGYRSAEENGDELCCRETEREREREREHAARILPLEALRSSTQTADITMRTAGSRALNYSGTTRFPRSSTTQRVHEITPSFHAADTGRSSPPLCVALSLRDCSPEPRRANERNDATARLTRVCPIKARLAEGRGGGGDFSIEISMKLS